MGERAAAAAADADGPFAGLKAAGPTLLSETHPRLLTLISTFPYGAVSSSSEPFSMVSDGLPYSLYHLQNPCVLEEVNSSLRSKFGTKKCT